MTKDKKPILFDEIEWGNTSDDILDPNWNRKKTKQQKQISKTKSTQHYNLGEYILRSPGNDLLDFYDSMMLRLDKNSKAWSYIPPSIVYKFRFKFNFPKFVFDKSKNVGINSYLLATLKNYYNSEDKTYWSQIYKTRFSWLVDEPHTEYKFINVSDLNDFIYKKFKQSRNNNSMNAKNLITKQIDDINQICLETMYWRGDLAGWSIIFKPNDRFYELIKNKEYKILNLQKYQHPKIINIPNNFYRYINEDICHTDNGVMFRKDACEFYNISRNTLLKWFKDKTKKNFYSFNKNEYFKFCLKNNLDFYHLT